MKHFSFYHKDTGAFATHWYGASEPLIELNTPPDHIAIEGRFHPLAHRFDLEKKTVVRAESPSADHEWSEQVGAWVLTAAALSKEAAASAYRQRLAELADEERSLHRRIVRTPGDARALARLAEIDDELERLRSAAQ
jgi:hypothetical protein